LDSDIPARKYFNFYLLFQLKKNQIIYTQKTLFVKEIAVLGPVQGKIEKKTRKK